MDPNLRQQYIEWRDERGAAGEDADDWQAFRRHVQDIGGEDPGEMRPTDF